MGQTEQISPAAGSLDGLLAGDKVGVWVALESSADLVIYDANLGIRLETPANLST